MTNKFAPKNFARAAMALTLAGAVALPAGQAVAASKTESALIGALIGGVAGAAIGDGKGEAVAIGAVAGAALGAAAGNDKNRRHYRNGYAYRTSRPYYRDTRYRSYDRSYDRGYYSGRSYQRGYGGYDTYYDYRR